MEVYQEAGSCMAILAASGSPANTLQTRMISQWSHLQVQDARLTSPHSEVLTIRYIVHAHRTITLNATVSRFLRPTLIDSEVVMAHLGRTMRVCSGCSQEPCVQPQTEP